MWWTAYALVNGWLTVRFGELTVGREHTFRAEKFLCFFFRGGVFRGNILEVPAAGREDPFRPSHNLHVDHDTYVRLAQPKIVVLSVTFEDRMEGQLIQLLKPEPN